jgi:hypothetical protein
LEFCWRRDDTNNTTEQQKKKLERCHAQWVPQTDSWLAHFIKYVQQRRRGRSCYLPYGTAAAALCASYAAMQFLARSTCRVSRVLLLLLLGTHS